MHLRARREEKARRTDAADIRKAPGIETSMAQSTLAWEGARSYHQHLGRLPSQAALIARARLFRPVDVSTRPRPGRLRVLASYGRDAIDRDFSHLVG